MILSSPIRVYGIILQQFPQHISHNYSQFHMDMVNIFNNDKHGGTLDPILGVQPLIIG